MCNISSSSSSICDNRKDGSSGDRCDSESSSCIVIKVVLVKVKVVTGNRAKGEKGEKKERRGT